MRRHFQAGLCLALLVWCMPCSVKAQENTKDEAPTVVGPVPPFHQRERVKAVRDRVYIDMRYPEFGLPFVDDDIRERADRHQTLAEFDFMVSELEPDAPYWYGMAYDVYSSKPGLLSVALFTSTNQGMPNVNWRVQGATWDLDARRRVSLGDIFPRWEASREKLRALFRTYAADPDRQNCADVLDSGLDDWLCPENDNILLYPPGYDWDRRLGLVFHLSDPATWGCAILSLTSEELAAAGADFRFWQE